MNWTEVKIYTTTAGIDPLTGSMLDLGLQGFMIEDAQDFDEFLHDTTPHWDYVDQAVMEKMKDCETCVTIYVADNHPVQVGEHLVVCPSWEAYDRQPDDVVLTLNPGMAFGTGTHDTTRLCMELLEKYITPQDTVLDVGCGSGILAITAALLGANKIIGCDIDEVAVKVAGENAALNGVQDRIAFHQGDLTSQVEGSFQIICANIVADVIIRLSEDAGRYLAKDGIFITSGIIDTREQDVLNALEQNGFQVIERRTSGGWVALACKAKAQ